MSLMTHRNLTAYDEYELFTDSSPAEIIKYRNKKIKCIEKNAKFVSKLLKGKKSTILEWGSGNSKFLYSMENKGLLNKGYGLEISKSRHEFAEKWKRDDNYNKVVNIHTDVLEGSYEKYSPYDLLYCVDLTFQFFEPVSIKRTYNILNNIYENLANDGKLVLELDSCERILTVMNNNKTKSWEEFSQPDPWHYALWDCAYDEKSKFLKFDKVFLKRDSTEKSYSNVILRVYTRLEICEILENIGFKNVRIYENWDNKHPSLGDEYIVVGDKHV
jgi:SAM-dependent methyltransferase